LSDRSYSPVLPFDGTQNDSFLIYDNERYVCHVDHYKSESQVRLHHNTMVKYYSCKVSEEPVLLGGD